MAENRNVSSSFEDLVSSSDLISPGPPKILQLKTKQVKIGSLTRVTVGEKHETRPNKTILLVGETGTGKSTLVNALFNYTVGVKFDDELWFQIVDRSQTSDVIVYQVFGSEDQTLPFSLTIIDTPGYGDKQMFDHNTRINQQLMELFQSDDGVHEVHAVGLVMKEGENPVSDRLKNIYDFIKTLFGEDVEKNIVALLTNSHGEPENVLQALEAADIKCAKDEENETVYFQFDNRQDKKRTKKSKTSLENAWRVTESGMEELTAFLENSSPQQKAAMLEEQRERIRLTACIQNLQERIRFTELKLRDVERTQEAVWNSEQEMKGDSNFDVFIPEIYKDMEPLRDATYGSDTAVCCVLCEENCHYPGCRTALNPQQCEVMIDGKCTSCTNKCPASDHGKINLRFVIRTKMVQRKINALEQQYEQEAGENLKLSKRFEKEKIKLRAERRQLIHEVHGLFTKLYELTMNDDTNDDSASKYIILDFLINKMKGQEDDEKLKELKEIFHQMDEKTRTSLQHRIGLPSSNLKVLISESVQIHKEFPAVYQLIPKKELIGTLTKLTFGERDEMKPNKIILLVGETGAGKSTLIDALFNYAVGVKFEDEVWFQIVEENRSHQTQSQTSDVIVYQIFGYEGQTLPFSLTIIDTPGFGDTRGKKQDAIVIRRLFDLFRSEDGVHEINAVGLVMKATDNRLSDRLMYVFNSVMSLFGKDMERNIVALITHSDGTTPRNALQALGDANIKCSTDEKNQPVHFMFNNQQKAQRYTTEKDRGSLKSSWDFTNEQIDHLKSFLEKTRPQPLETTVEVLNERISLTACIQNLKERIGLNEKKQKEIRLIKEAYNVHEAEMNKNKNFTVEVDEAYKEKETISGGIWDKVFYEGAVTCSVCEENCHSGCTITWNPEHCKVMNKGRCTVCTNKCPVSVHVKEKWRYVMKTRKVQKTLEDVKEKYEKNKAGCDTKLSLLENLEKESNELKAEWSSMLDQAYQHVIRLDEIALKAESGSTLIHLEFLTDKMKDRQDEEKVTKLEEMKKRIDNDHHQYMYTDGFMWI